MRPIPETRPQADSHLGVVLSNLCDILSEVISIVRAYINSDFLT